jgi:hypothetical protein
MTVAVSRTSRPRLSGWRLGVGLATFPDWTADARPWSGRSSGLGSVRSSVLSARRCPGRPLDLPMGLARCGAGALSRARRRRGFRRLVPTQVGSAWRLARRDDPAGVAGRHGDRASRNPIRGPRSPDRPPPCRPGPARARGRRGATDVDRRGGRRHQQPHQGHEPGEAEGRASVGRRHEDRPPPAGVPVGLVDPGELVDQHGRLDFDRCVLKEGLEGPDRPAPERSCPDAPIGRSATGLRDHRHVGEAADRGVCTADPSLASRAWKGGSRACGVSPRARDDGTRLTAPSSWCRQDAPVARLEQRATHDLR